MAQDRQDDVSISGDVRLWRRIPNWPKNYKFDEKRNRSRPTSINFRDRSNELSVNIADETTKEQVLKGFSGFGLVEFTAGLVREILGQTVVICRDPEPGNPSHVLICGKVSQGQSEKLAKNCHWVVEPELPLEISENKQDVANADPPSHGTKPPVNGQALRRIRVPFFLVLLLILTAIVIFLLFRD